MDLETVRAVLGWCAVINYGVLLVWAAMFTLAHDTLHAMHGTWFGIRREDFDRIHYWSMGVYKIVILVFNLVPYLALRIVG